MDTQAQDRYPLAAYFIAAALAAAVAGGAYFGYRQQVQTRRDVQASIRTWYEGPRLTAELMMERYVVPDEFTPVDANWYGRGSWKRISIQGDTPYQYLEQAVGYRARPEEAARLIDFDHGVRYDAPNEELSASSNHESLNYLALNLADEVAAGKRSSRKARDFYASTARLSASGKSSPYLQGLLFNPYRRMSQMDLSRKYPIKL
ncbi:MAG: hypothetical protein PHS14_12580 [Elusimicrobia bacterium]|nr:hypothetical protein [Elusimicrobiota bacterium]